MKSLSIKTHQFVSFLGCNQIEARAVHQAVRCALFLLFIANTVQAQRLKDLTIPTPIPKGSTLVIGILGGWENWNDANRGVRKTALNLRQMPGVYADVIENHKMEIIPKLIERALDANRDRKLDEVERASARIIIFGQSLGGQATVRLARILRKRRIPVLLTVQVDSVGVNDRTIPDNVRTAVNLYQRELLTIRGQARIRPADPSRTRILANKQFHYPPFRGEAPPPKGWVRRSIGGGHLRMEADPAVWAEVESYIRQAITH